MRQTPLSHSFCRHVKDGAAPIAVPDAREDPMFCNNPAIGALGVIGYLGVPVMGPDGGPIGALCVIQDRPRAWSEIDLQMLQDLARCVTDEIQLRATSRMACMLRAEVEEQHCRALRHAAVSESLAQAFMMPDLPTATRFGELLKAGCRALGTERGAIARTSGGAAEVLFSHPDPATCPPDPKDLTDTFAQAILCGEEQICLFDTIGTKTEGRQTLCGAPARSYAGTPLVLNGALFGVLEFSSASPRSSAWSAEDLSLLSMISLFACAHLGMLGEIRALRASEAALIEALNRARRQGGVTARVANRRPA